MKKNIFVFLLLVLCFFNGGFAAQVSCETIENNSGFGWGAWKTCYMDQTTEINSADTTIASRDESVQGLRFYINKKIKFLPIGLSEKFPNLGGLGAVSCSLTTISKANFKDLSKLRFLTLSANQIEKIPSDVFNDLVALEKLFLYKNKLKFINAKAFARLTKLTRVDLSSNQCINENFDGASRIAVLQQTVNEKCPFDELENSSVETSIMTTTTVSSLADKKCEKSQYLANFTKKCESNAKALEAQTKICNQQQTYLNEALANKTAEIIDVKVKSEIQQMLKMTEIQRLEEELQRKNAEIIENRQKIKNLEQKNAVLLGSAGNCP